MYWNSYLNKWLTDRIKACQLCQRNKAARLIFGESGKMPIATLPMQRLQIDVTEPYPKSKQKNKFILIAINSFSRDKW